MKMRQVGLVALLGISTAFLMGCPGGTLPPNGTNVGDNTSTDDTSDDVTTGDCALGGVDNIRGCECYWEAQITGDFNGTFSGTFAVFTLIPGQSGSALAFDFQEFIGAIGESANAFPVGTNDATSGSIGVFDVALTVTDGPNFFTGGGEASEVQLEITSNTGGSIDGMITGMLAGPDPDDPTASREVQVTLSFRASEQSLFSVPCSGTAP